MIWTLLLILFLIVYPFWLFIKLARYGRSISRPNFDRMKREVDAWSGISINGRFAWNRTFGKIIYYLLLIYLIFFVGYFIWSLVV